MQVPYFAGQSALVHAIPSPVANVFSLDVSLKPNASDAEVLLVTSRQQMNHYIILRLQDGRLTLTVSFNGSTTSLPHPLFIADNEWRVVSLAVNNRFMELTVGDASEQTNTPSDPNGDSQFVFDGAVHLGGAALCTVFPCPLLTSSAGYVGCMRDLQVNVIPLDIVADALQGADIAQCPVAACSTVVCQNGGVCMGITSVNFTCVCLEGFSGRFCEVRLDVCSPSPCLFGGVCAANGSTFYCACALGRAGRMCEIGKAGTTPTSLCATPTSVSAMSTSLSVTHTHHLYLRNLRTSFHATPASVCITSSSFCGTPASLCNIPASCTLCHVHIICVTLHHFVHT